MLKVVRDNSSLRYKNEQLVQMNIQLTQDLVKQQTVARLPNFKGNFVPNSEASQQIQAHLGLN